nr:hypothetical protein [uncultured bacterium]
MIMSGVLWIAALLAGFALLWLLDRREKWIKAGEWKLKGKLERRMIHALIVITLSIPAAYFLPKFGIRVDFADIIVGAILGVVGWLVASEIQEGIG